MALPLVIKTPATIMLAGPSSCGKSSLVQKIITRLNEVFDRPPQRVVICYDRDQELYAEIRRHSPVPVEMVKGLSPNLKPPPPELCWCLTTYSRALNLFAIGLRKTAIITIAI